MKTIQVGPSIQFIYRMNVCANTLTTCQQEAAPATEVRALVSPPLGCVRPLRLSHTLENGMSLSSGGRVVCLCLDLEAPHSPSIRDFVSIS